MAFFNPGLDLLRDIATLDLRWLLRKPGAVDPDTAFVAALVAGSMEISVAGYSRPAISGESRVLNNTTNRTEYLADNPNFGSLTTGQDVGTGILYVHVTNDSDSVPVLAVTVSETGIDTADLDPFVINFPTGVIAYIDEGS